MRMNKIIITTFFVCTLSFLSGQTIKNHKSINNDNCIILKYNEFIECKVLKINNIIVENIDSTCEDFSNFTDDFSDYYPVLNIFQVDQIFKPSDSLKIFFWKNGNKQGIYSFPFNYSKLKIDNLQDDSIVSCTINNIKFNLKPKENYDDSIIEIKNEGNRLIKYITKIHAINLGFIPKKNIIDNENWDKKRFDLYIDAPFNVDIKPEFPGGEKALSEYFHKNIIIPNGITKDELSGMIYTQIVIDPTGRVTTARILRCENDVFCYEAKRLFETMPHWIPGKNYGKETA